MSIELKEVQGQDIKLINHESMQAPFEIPIPHRNKRGKIIWKLAGNTDLENEQIGIRNIQGLFLEKFSEFNIQFPRIEEGKIAEDKREEAKAFILDKIKDRKSFKAIFGQSPLSPKYTYYFERSHYTILEKSFTNWGINFNFPQKSPEGWETAWALRKQGINHYTSVKIAKTYRPEHLDWFQIYRSVTGINEHYSPELVSKITQEIEGEKAPDGWKTAWALRKPLRTGIEFLAKIAEEFRSDHLEWFKFYRSQNRVKVEHYSPELVSLIIQNLKNKAPEGWQTVNTLRELLNVSDKTIKKIAEEFRLTHSDWYKFYHSRSGMREHYSSQLIVEIKEVINQKRNASEPISPEQANEQLRKLLEGNV